MRRILSFSVLLLALAIVPLSLAMTNRINAPASATSLTLRGVVGPGFTIALYNGMKRVSALKAGTYSIKVADKSNIHNFVLSKGSVKKQLTGVSFVGTKTVVVKLTSGKWSYVCTPHALVMHGSFSVR